jgi:ABC-2 type transport system permease protein
MLADLLIKDLKRTRRNPWPILIFLAIPLCITGLIGLAFSPKAAGGGLGKIKVALVDEDDSILGGFLRSASSQGEATEHLETRVVTRAEGEALLLENQVSAMLVLPEGFTEGLLEGKPPPPLELVKNPAQSFHPAIVEELLGAAAELLGAAAGLVQDELPEWRRLVETEDRLDYLLLARLITETGNRIKAVEDYVSPPLVSYRQETRPGRNAEGPEINVFAWILPGMASMFLLFIGDGAMRDLYKEVRFRTLDRYRTMRTRLTPLLLAKMLHALLVMLAGAAIMFGGGALVFGIGWREPLWLILLAASFSLCGAGVLAVVASLARSEKRADVLNSMLIFGIAFLGGSMFPINALPAFIRNGVSPLLPNYWLVQGIRQLQDPGFDGRILLMIGGLTLAGLVLAGIASLRFNRVLQEGIRE